MLRSVLSGLCLVASGLVTGCGSISILNTPDAGDTIVAEVEIRTDCKFRLDVTFVDAGGKRTKANVTSLVDNNFFDLGLDYDADMQIRVEVLEATTSCPFAAGERWIWPAQPPGGVSYGKLTDRGGWYRVSLYDFQSMQDTGLDMSIRD